MALAYFISFSTYGTWLHGTDKGFGSVDREHNRFGDAFVKPNAARLENAHMSMTQAAFVLSPQERAIVRHAIVELCSEREWTLLAVHVRTNHIHVVVTAERDPGRLMSDLKARASRNLTRAGFADAERRRWTRHGSTLHLFSENAVAEKIEYTLYKQGVPMATYPETHDQEPRTK